MRSWFGYAQVSPSGETMGLEDLGPYLGLVQHVRVEELQPTAVEPDRAVKVGIQQLGEIGAQVLRARVIGSSGQWSKNSAVHRMVRA